MARADDLRAELDLLDLEERYAQAKAGGASKDELRGMGLREARQAFRETRESVEPDEGAARPAPARASARVKGKGDEK